MPSDDAIQLPLLLSPQWWCRLQRVAEACYASPRDFIHEVVEAEIVRRELLLEQQGDFDPQWLALVSTTPTQSQLQ
jgi:hypothetical protein